MLLFRVTVVETKRVLGKAAPVRDKRIAETPVVEFIQFCVQCKIRKAKRYSVYHQRKLLNPSNVGIWSLLVRNVGCLDCYMFRRSYGMDKRDRKLGRVVTKLPVCWKHFHWPVRCRTNFVMYVLYDGKCKQHLYPHSLFFKTI